MATFDKIKKKRSRLPAPPPPEAAPNNTSQPEHGRVEPTKKVAVEVVDQRTLKKTGRTKQFATRVTPEFEREFRVYAAQNSLKLVELLERSFEAYKKLNS